MTTGQRIKAARQQAGLTQTKLAEKLGIPYQSVSQWERDLRKPKYENLKRIATVLEVPAESLLDVDDIIGKLKEAGNNWQEGVRDGITICVKSIKTMAEELIAGAEELKQIMLEEAYNSMNDNGQNKVIEYAQDLAKIPEYQRQPTENSPESTETALEGKDTTPDKTPTETPQNPPEDET